MSTLASERKSVQAPLIKYVCEIGWEFVSREQAEKLRGGTRGLLFHSVLKDSLISLNPGLIDSKNVGEVIGKINSVRHDIRGNRNALGWMRGEESVYCEKQKRRLNVSVIDYENPGSNVFQVADEWTVSGVENPRRADVVFLINGIAVCVVETKGPVKKDGIYEGLTQIRQYHRDTPAMFALAQIFDITNLPEFYYGATWNTEAKNLFNWKDEREGDFEIKVKNFFDRERFLKVIGRWVVFYQRDDELKKTVLRQHQTRAAQRIENRCASSDKRRGLIWHTQGSGKTFTMIKAAELVIKHKTRLGDPTVILMIDRNELEGQLSGWISSLCSEGATAAVNVRRAETKNDLRQILKSDFRGLVVSMIHKFDDMPANINPRKNIFIFIDEAHRSIGGELGNYLTGALPNATLIGFTGTPVDKTAYGKGTFKIFGKDDENGYLDKYSIMESIKDGTTVELKYKLAPIEMTVPEEMLEKQFLQMAEAEGLDDIERLNKVLEKAVTLKNFLKAEDRIRQVAEFAATHFKENVLPLRYKAFFVAVDREACALYKKEFDKLLAPAAVEAVYSKSQHDTEKLPLVAKYQVSEDEEKSLRKKFVKPGEDPKLFIVTDKLLTGFDAPILYCMYLDKPMRDHVLLQSIARVNRPYCFAGEEKPHGLIVDFIGILKDMKKALAFDSKDVSGVIEDIETLFESFAKKMREAEKYLKITDGLRSDKAVEKIIEHFSDKSEREKFLEFFREMQSLYEVLSPDAKLRDFLDDYKNLCAMYEIVMKEFETEELPAEYRQFQKKTERLIKETVGAFGTEEKEIETVVSERTLEEISKSGKSDKVKVHNLLKVLEKLIQEIKSALGLESMAEKARRIREKYEESRAGARETAEELNRFAREMLDLKRRFRNSGKSARQFVFQITLEEAGDENAEKNAAQAEELFNRFPNHFENEDQKRRLKSALYTIAGPAVGREAEKSVVEELIKLDERFKKEVQE